MIIVVLLKGFMENTLLFYGYYENTINSLSSSNFSYNLPLAYVLIAFSYFFLSLALIVRRWDFEISFIVIDNYRYYFE